MTRKRATVASPTILIIIGITGDLSKRKLLPAIEKIAASETLPNELRIVGVSRSNISVTELLGGMPADFLRENLEIFSMDLTAGKDYIALKAYLQTLERKLGGKAQKLFYLSVPPQISYPIVEQLGQHVADDKTTKLLLEKPFGINLESANELVEQVRGHFAEDQVYRIDHYLAKEMAQNLVVFRQSNSLFKQTWNRDFVESIDIVASETIGIEGRAMFYEQTGALRDVMQSHLMQLAALTLAELPEDENWHDIPARRLQALQQLSTPQDIATETTRGQYDGYRAETANPTSTVETFAAVRLESRDPRWQGVPIRLITGKALDTKTTEIRIRYKRRSANEANTLVLHIQPDEGIEVDLWAKRPGYDRELTKVPLRMSYAETAIPEAYERVLLDAIRADHSLFTTSAEVLETWRILEPVQKAWAMSDDDLRVYKPGSSPHDILAS